MDEDDAIQIVSSGSGDDSSSDSDEESPEVIMDTPPARSPEQIVERPLDFTLLASRLGVQPLPSSPGRVPASRAVISRARLAASPYHRPSMYSPQYLRASTPTEESSQQPDIGSTSTPLPASPHTGTSTDNNPVPGPSVMNTSVVEFQTPKRVMVPAPVIKNSTSKDLVQEEEGQDCPICFEPWTNSGSHRLASLKCGHLFGQSCIEKWLKGQGLKCPQCNVNARRKDIRVIYAKALKVADTSEKDRALQELENERTARKVAEMQAAETRLFLQLARDECRRLTEDLNRQKQHIDQMKMSGAASGSDIQVHSSQVLTSPTKMTQNQRAMFTVEKKVKICDNGQCRVMAFSPSHSTLCVSQPSANPLFPGFGVKKLNTVDFRTTQYVALHSKMIRDLALNTYGSEGLLLSASMDKTIKLTSLVSNTVVQSYTCPFAAWSCAWNSDDHNYLYAGLQNGTVCLFDTRNTQGAVKILNEGTTMSPAVSLQYIKRNPNAQFSVGGLLIAQLNRTQFLEAKPSDDYKVHMFPLEGSVTSLSIDDRSRHLLATYRPVQTQPSVRHILYEMSRMSLGSGPAVYADVCTCQRVQSFQGGSTMKVLSRSKLMGHLGAGGLVVAGDEASQCVHVWDIQSGLLHQKIPIHAPVIDVANIHSNQQPYLAALTDKQVTILKWTEH